MSDEPQKPYAPVARKEAFGRVPLEPAEAKRLMARRRFMLGGASSVSVLLTPQRVHAGTTVSACVADLVLQFGGSSQFWLFFLRNVLQFEYFVPWDDCIWIDGFDPTNALETTSLTSSAGTSSADPLSSDSVSSDPLSGEALVEEPVEDPRCPLVRKPVTYEEKLLYEEIMRHLGCSGY